MKKPIVRFVVAVVVALVLAAPAAPYAARLATGPLCYVDIDATGSNNGNSWTNAYLSLQSALNDTNCEEIWVAEGIYRPGTSQDDSFEVKNGVEVYGGFAGSETERSQRNWTKHVTILSGDIKGDDLNDDLNDITEVFGQIVGSNSYHVVSMGSGFLVTSSTVLDGFTVTGGDAGAASNGGGLLCNGSGATRQCNPTLTNLTFCGNRAYNGGAIYLDGSSSGDSSPTLSNAAFFGNSSANSGGAIFDNGPSSGVSSPTLANVTFTLNSADQGGAMYNYGSSDGTSQPTLTNVILWDDTASTTEGSEVEDYGGIPTISYSIVEGTCGVISGAYCGSGNLEDDPLFVNAASYDLRLQSTSPAIDVGNNSAVPLDVETDLDGNARFVDYPWVEAGSGTSPIVDMGAYELQFDCPETSMLYVDASATGGDTGASWTDAFTDLQDGLAVAKACPASSEIWVAAGQYTPTSGTDQGISFTIPHHVEVYGGFAGTETLRSQRDPAAHVTILSGDIDHNDTDSDGNHITDSYVEIQGSNSHHVLIVDGTAGQAITNTTVLDGFTITAGDATDQGGGLWCKGSGSGHVCSPNLLNLSFAGNRAGYGGAIYDDGVAGGMSSPWLVYVKFSGNIASYGGAIDNAAEGGTSSPTLINVTFNANRGWVLGGAIFNDARLTGVSSPTITNATFSGNDGQQCGGAICNLASHGGTSSPIVIGATFSGNHAAAAGAIGNEAWYTGTVVSPTLTNVTFSGNYASEGGAIRTVAGYSAVSSPTLTNVTFNGNSAGYGGAIYSIAIGSTGNATLSNVILWGDMATIMGQEIYNDSATPTIDHSVVQGGCPSGSTCTNFFTTDPKLAPLSDNGGFANTLPLIWGSSAIDAGNDVTCPDTDQRGVSRPQHGNCDIGALERVPPGIHADFESDGIADMGYFHPATGLWAILDSSEGFSYAAPRYYSWGQTGDILALGDYDGDGRMDPTVRRPPAGGQSAAYLILLSTTGYNFGSSLTVPAGWPGLGDTPVVGDFNGDGFSDPAIWRGNTGVWIIPLSPSFNTYQFYAWGASGDTPVGADVDGDGQTDIGYWRPSTGVWGFLQSSMGYSYASPLFFSWGMSGDIAVMADYDGDGYADPATVIPPAGGQSRAYRILLSTLAYDPAQSVTVPAGWPGLNDTPVPADYDGDGKADAGIWRGNTGVWIIPKSSTNNTGYLFAAWGASGDQIAR